MSDLGDLLDAPLGELPAAITVDVYALALAEIHDARAEIERLRRELGHARSRATALAALRREAGEQLDQATAGLERLRAELRECREQLDDARDAYGDKLCPRCSAEVAAEAAAEKENTDG